ncbi:protein FAR1-RELATED SEQUENCE 5-like [Coffea arabica]|uniref:Protein FAR1-RELATED SEQUENCE 5-like n=1 Tax=Coffea arabica TaxID=13443 RepID=A0ABM4UF86_COFAR
MGQDGVLKTHDMVQEIEKGKMGMDGCGRLMSFDLNQEPECDRDTCSEESGGSIGGHEDEEADELVGAIGVDDVMKLTFDTEEEAGEFYNLYAKLSGFGIRKSNAKRDEDGISRFRKWVCCCEGYRNEKWFNYEDRKREAKAITRTGCGACFRVKYDTESVKYVVTRFIMEHNHPLASEASVQHLRSHRKVSDAEYAQAKSLKLVGARICQIMKHFVIKAGGYSNVGFCIKDLYNRMDEERRKDIFNGDAEGALGFLAAKKDADDMFFYKYHVDNEGRLARLFWSDSKSRVDFSVFGDVLVFDTTYKTNKYRKPLVVLAGVNNHLNSTIFGCALLSDERIETYEWVLSTFVEAMKGRKPVAVMTDGDSAMRRAIKNLLPDACHRLCSWHLHRNARSNIRCEEFNNRLYDLMARKFSTLEFEDRWARLVNECGVVENEWVKKLYRRRRLWAEAYLRGNFFAGMRSTQRCEKMNAFLNEYLNEKMRLYEFVRSFDLAIAWLRHTESKAVHTSENTKPVLTTILPELEASAAEVFTRNVFFMVRKHLNRQGLLISEGWSEDGGSRTYYYSKYGGHEISWRVVYDRSMEKLICSCMKFESKGIPCAHMFRVMVVEGMNRIPEACISKRWTKGVYSTNNGMKAFVADEQLTQMARYGTLKSSCNSMCYYASYMDDAFNDLQQMFDKHSVDLKEKWIERGYGGDGFAMDSRVMNDRSRRTFGLLDPRVSRCKGDQKHSETKKKRKCGHCRQATTNEHAHTKRIRTTQQFMMIIWKIVWMNRWKNHLKLVRGGATQANGEDKHLHHKHAVAVEGTQVTNKEVQEKDEAQLL